MRDGELATPANHGEQPHESSRLEKPKRRRGRGLIVLVVVAFVTYLTRDTLLHAVASGLVVRDTSRKADFALILGGDRCYEEASRQYHAGTVRGILLIEFIPSRLVRIGVLPSDEELARRELSKHGVPETAIEIVRGQATSMWDAARHTEEWLNEHSGARLLILCPRFSARERRWIFSRVLGTGEAGDLTWHGLRDRRYDETTWWHRKEGVLDVFNSYVSLGYVWLNGEQPSTWHEWDAEEWLAVSFDGNRKRE